MIENLAYNLTKKGNFRIVLSYECENRTANISSAVSIVLLFCFVFDGCVKCVWNCVIVVYSNSAQEHLNTILYTGFVEELVDILELKDAHLTVRFCDLQVLLFSLRASLPFLC